ncbi:hypothetical protein ACH4C6_14890 [Streptomyces sp. NPDC017943]|uniref:hypothetical protein n=1 Tax=Streptomyces sp. NPDC017943 TaxID=3365019 RepID=UPI00379DB8F0
MQNTRARMLAAVTPTGRPHPLLAAEAAEVTRERADQLAAESADRYIAREYPHVAALLAEPAAGGTGSVQPAGLLTVPQQTLTYDDGLGAWRTAPIESAMRDIDDQHTTEENAGVPLFSAEVVVSDWKTLPPVEVDGRFVSGGSVDGRFTQLWLSYGDTTGTVTPAKAREIVAEMRSFAARLEALCDVADGIAADDYEAGA